ncbi:MAG: glycine cleavage system protein T [Chloroflexi bacterium]|nr:glycine cleavage system protein T [Chloroflexota bacterium]
MTLPIADEAYTAAHTHAAAYHATAADVLRIAGPDRIDFLQRQSTNDVTQLNPDTAVVTVLTSATARILDVLTLITDGEAIHAVTLPGRETAAFLRSRIFFMDKVTVEETDLSVVDIFGPQAAAALAEAGLPDPSDTNGVTRADGAVVVVTLADRIRLLTPEPAALLARLDMPVLSPEGYTVYRVENGIPLGELSEEYTPLETRLGAHVSDAKGCYTGQEIIARQITYDKVTKRLVGLLLDEPVEAGTDVRSEGSRAGTITTAVESPRFGPAALAVLKRDYIAPGTAVSVDGVGGRVVELPMKT